METRALGPGLGARMEITSSGRHSLLFQQQQQHPLHRDRRGGSRRRRRTTRRRRRRRKKRRRKNENERKKQTVSQWVGQRERLHLLSYGTDIISDHFNSQSWLACTKMGPLFFFNLAKKKKEKSTARPARGRGGRHRGFTFFLALVAANQTAG